MGHHSACASASSDGGAKAGQRLGPGRVVLVVGPSGAGKDSVLRAAMARLASAPRFVFPRRTVTRPPSADEDNLSVDDATFAALAASGAFALHWEAHGHCYGLPQTIDLAVGRGATVVCNVSRTVIDAARARYADVTVVGITATHSVLAARIANRARESGGALTARLDRAQAFADLRCDVDIDNSGPLDRAVTAFVSILADR
ncbi:phosphonate metabolism protein/1,5-bisphosphokinase (PRPP-forming) PhnN [Chelatococcus sp. GCM10030263]|uniref:phosphonate metabolism protein/1,5-bisphosphokinase (PRPP-forming) PhnN n=1 Tax=Chelatococcus sp. GCM10030263 TaxID=3273387 RepID=UPI00362449C7